MSMLMPADPDHGHKHWNQPRTPGRSVIRNQKRARGEFRPRRRFHTKRRTGPTAGAPLAIPSVGPMLFNPLNALKRRMGGDR